MERLTQSAAFKRFWDIAGAANIRIKVLGIVLGVIGLLGLFVIFQIRDVLSTALTNRLVEQSSALAHDITDQIHQINLLGLNDSLDDFLAEWQAHYSNNGHNTHVVYLVITDSDGEMIASANGLTPPEPLPENEVFTEIHDDDPSHQATVYIRNNYVEATHKVPEEPIYLRIAFTLEDIHATVDQVTFQLLQTTLVMIAVGFAAAFFLTWILTRPIIDLVQATQLVAKGDFSRRVTRWANDEIGVLADAFNDMTASLEQAEQERIEREALREHYVSGVIVAQENERQRIARELHDSTGQSLTSILVGLQNLKIIDGEVKREEHIETLRQTVLNTIDEVRSMAWTLRPSVLDDLGLTRALEHYITNYQRQYNIDVDFTVSGLKARMSNDLEAAIYRIVQEGLTNVARHAQATTCSIVISRRTTSDGDLLLIIIEDDGIGLDTEEALKSSKSLGLYGIRERATLFGGKFTIESQYGDDHAGHGTTLYIEIPLNTED